MASGQAGLKSTETPHLAGDKLADSGEAVKCVIVSEGIFVCVNASLVCILCVCQVVVLVVNIISLSGASHLIHLKQIVANYR